MPRILKQEDLIQIHKILENDFTGRKLAFIQGAVVRFYLGSPDSTQLKSPMARSFLQRFPDVKNNAWTDTGYSGVICLVYDKVRHGLYFKLVSVSKQKSTFEYEIYLDFKYLRLNDDLHCFEIDDCVLGFAFASQEESRSFYKSVTRTIQQFNDLNYNRELFKSKKKNLVPKLTKKEKRKKNKGMKGRKGSFIIFGGSSTNNSKTRSRINEVKVSSHASMSKTSSKGSITTKGTANSHNSSSRRKKKTQPADVLIPAMYKDEKQKKGLLGTIFRSNKGSGSKLSRRKGKGSKRIPRPKTASMPAPNSPPPRQTPSMPAPSSPGYFKSGSGGSFSGNPPKSPSPFKSPGFVPPSPSPRFAPPSPSPSYGSPGFAPPSPTPSFASPRQTPTSPHFGTPLMPKTQRTARAEEYDELPPAYDPTTMTNQPPPVPKKFPRKANVSKKAPVIVESADFGSRRSYELADENVISYQKNLNVDTLSVDFKRLLKKAGIKKKYMKNPKFSVAILRDLQKADMMQDLKDDGNYKNYGNDKLESAVDEMNDAEFQDFYKKNNKYQEEAQEKKRLLQWEQKHKNKKQRAPQVHTRKFNKHTSALVKHNKALQGGVPSQSFNFNALGSRGNERSGSSGVNDFGPPPPPRDNFVKQTARPVLPVKQTRRTPGQSRQKPRFMEDIAEGRFRKADNQDFNFTMRRIKKKVQTGATKENLIVGLLRDKLKERRAMVDYNSDSGTDWSSSDEETNY